MITNLKKMLQEDIERFDDKTTDQWHDEHVSPEYDNDTTTTSNYLSNLYQFKKFHDELIKYGWSPGVPLLDKLGAIPKEEVDNAIAEEEMRIQKKHNKMQM